MGKNQKDEGEILWAEKGDLAYLATVALSIEKIRVAAQSRIAHLNKTRRTSPDTERILKEAKKFEAFADGRLAAYISVHPVWPWAKRIKGIDQENYAKIIGEIENFGRFYDIGDPRIPPHVKRPPKRYWKVQQDKAVEREGIFVKGIERLTKPSKLHRYSGLSVYSETGEVPKQRKGHNVQLKMALYRLGVGLNRARGIWYQGGKENGCSPGYLGFRAELISKAEAEGIRIVPTPGERVCPNCGREFPEKATDFCDNCGEELTKKTEPPGYLFKDHLDNKATREMLRDFVTCLWLVWRKAEGLPVTEPWGDRPPLDPRKMVDM